MKNYIFLYFLILPLSIIAQNTIAISAVFDTEKKEIKITQQISYQNNSDKVLNNIYLQDWSHSFSSKNTPLGKRFEEEFKNAFIFSKKEDFGHTSIESITENNNSLTYNRLSDNQDIIKVKLNKPLASNNSYNITIKYVIKVPNDKFTRYGFTNRNDFKLYYWYITPAIFDGEWHYFSNKDLNDALVPKCNITIKAQYPKEYTLISELNTLKTDINDSTKTTFLEGENRINDKLFLVKENNFKTIHLDDYLIQYNLDEEKLDQKKIHDITLKITNYLNEILGDYPHEKLLLTNLDYKKNQIYGLNSLPDFIRPYSDAFQFEIKLLKTALNNYLENTLLINQRENQWLFDGINLYFFIKYINDYYPDTKILGSLSKIWGVRSYYASKLKFNDQYKFMYMSMARSARDQPLSMAKDSLMKFNVNLSNKYKAGIGLEYLNDYVGDNTIENAIIAFVKDNNQKIITPKDFKKKIQASTTKNTDWFFDDFISTNKKIDYKLKKVNSNKDSITVTIKNNEPSKMPISLYTLKKDSVLSKQWITGFTGEKNIIIPRNKEITKIGLNYDGKIPEINERNNWKSLKKFPFKNRPLQFRFFQDVENPKRTQVFFIPEVSYNFYDGLMPGIKIYNQTPIKRNFNYRLSPRYGFKSKEIVGGLSASYRHFKENKSNYYIKYGFSAGANNYAPGFLYTSMTPYIDFAYRNKDDYRDNKRHLLLFRHVMIDREIDPTGEVKVDGEPSYNVFNARFTTADPNLNNFYSWSNDFQIAKNFGKLSSTLELRTLTPKNRQYNLRLFAGTFLFNNTYNDSDFFSFALDRPTDYLFDYEYIGRSEETGLLSQQIIIAEGGFKSKLPMPFANSWIATANASTTIWKYIQGYFDVGFVANRQKSAKFVYDSGVRLNLVTDYFELYFPVYSNLGWEVSQANYKDRIRFIVVLSPQTLTGLFKRRWY